MKVQPVPGHPELMTAVAHAPERTRLGGSADLDVGALFDEHGAFVHRVAERLAGSAAVADDVVQEVFLLAFSRRGELDNRVGVRTWLYRGAVNVVRHGYRADRRYRDALARLAMQGDRDAATPDQASEAAGQGRRIRACVARLSETQREVFVLFELEELEGAEIAVILDIPVNTVWSRLRLARAAFSAEWVATGGARP